jgi:hypothetical protein
MWTFESEPAPWAKALFDPGRLCHGDEVVDECLRCRGRFRGASCVPVEEQKRTSGCGEGKLARAHADGWHCS